MDVGLREDGHRRRHAARAGGDLHDPAVALHAAVRAGRPAGAKPLLAEPLDLAPGGRRPSEGHAPGQGEAGRAEPAEFAVFAGRAHRAGADLPAQQEVSRTPGRPLAPAGGRAPPGPRRVAPVRGPRAQRLLGHAARRDDVDLLLRPGIVRHARLRGLPAIRRPAVHHRVRRARRQGAVGQIPGAGAPLPGGGDAAEAEAGGEQVSHGGRLRALGGLVILRRRGHRGEG
mmetsp:Transcript_64154/g.170526  ORF Transcript_64154/g.170526 Transcript_64154/m.170526 type:complete len:229 (+) Transcript_64154:1222-1908(+)